MAGGGAGPHHDDLIAATHADIDLSTSTTTSTAPRSSSPETGPPRTVLRLLLDPIFGPFFFGKLLSTAGVWVFNIVAAVTVWDLSRSTIAVGAVSMALFLPQLAFAPASGAQADRGDPKPQLIVGRGLVAAASGALAIALHLLGVDGLPGSWVAIIVAAAVVGAGFVVGGPAQLSIVPSLVRSSELPQAVALNSLPPTLARAGGPLLGTLLLAAAGPATAFAVASLSSLAFAIVIVWLPLTRTAAAQGRAGSVRAGFAYVHSHPAVGYLLLGMLALGLGSDPVVTLTPALSASFGHGGELVGTFATVFGAGAAVAYLGVGPFGRRAGMHHLTTAGLGLLASGLVLTGTAVNVPWAMAGLTLAGVGFCWAMTGTTTQVYRMVPETFRGRTMALWAMAFAGSRPLGAAVSSALADSTTAAIALVGVGCVVAVLATVATRGAARHSGPAEAPRESTSRKAL